MIVRRPFPTLSLFAAAAVLWVGASAAPAQAAGCKSPSYCSRGGPCVTIGEVRQKARSAFGSPWRIQQIRLVGQAPTPTCLWYQVRAVGPGGAGKIAYWHVDGRRAR